MEGRKEEIEKKGEKKNWSRGEEAVNHVIGGGRARGGVVISLERGKEGKSECE